MFKIVIGTALALGIAAAQQPPATKLYSSAADVSAMMAKAKAERKDQPNIIQPILRSGTHSANLEYRAGVGPAATHMKEAEMFYVVDGGGTLVTGGKLANEKVTGDNASGTAIEGGESKKIAKGDFVIVPENTPHWFSAIDGTLVLMSVHLPK
jgi:mannose-6-phosphate isomerase-like protein (cupin superfamily)